MLKIAFEIFQTYTEYENRYFSWPTYEQYGFNDYHPNGYDAIWAAALALNASKEILAQEVMSNNFVSSTFPSLCYVKIFKISFVICRMLWKIT